MRTVMGIDEAGRGAVLGPLVIAGVMFEENKKVLDLLKSVGVKDSKLLSPDQRSRLAKLVLKTKIRHKTVKISPLEIDSSSINHLEVKHSCKIINSLKPNSVWLDVPASGRGVERYCDAVRDGVGFSCKVSGGNKMDSTNLAVSASSIIAKEAREKAVAELHKTYGDFGSGYPSDPKTRKWLIKNKKGSWPEIVRTKWLTLSRI